MTTDAESGTTVEIYKNIHRSRAAGKPIYSIRSKATRRVIDHSDVVWLNNATMVVKETGRQRVLREQRKNVHAWIEGTLCEEPANLPGEAVQLSYNPYLGSNFTATSQTEGSLGSVQTAEFVTLSQWVLGWNVKGDGEPS